MIRNLILLLMLLMTPTHGANGNENCVDGMKLFKLEDGSYDCFSCIDCPIGTLLTQECTGKHDTVCDPCYKSGFVGENETTCANCSVCKPGTFVERNCTKFENTVCIQCENGTFSDTYNAGSCKNCSSCEGQLTSACNRSRDTVCFYKDRRYFDVKAVILISIDVIVHVILISTCIYKQHQSVQQMRSDEGNGAASSNQEALILMTEGNKESECISLSSPQEKLMPSVGALILKIRGRIVQINVVFRVGSKYVMTAYRSLVEYVKLENKFKLHADEAYVTFDADPDDPSAVRYKISTNTPAYFNEHFDVLVLEIVQRNILLKPNIPEPINPSCIDIGKDTKLYFIDSALNVKASKWFQADIIAKDKVLTTHEYLKSQAAFYKKKLSDSMKKLYDTCIADAENTDEQWLFWKYDVSLRPGSPGFIRDTDGELKLCCMHTAHFSKLCDTLSQKEYIFAENYLLCTGIKMSAVYEDMNKKDKKLAKEIFGSFYMVEDADIPETMTSESIISLHDTHFEFVDSTVDDWEGYVAKPGSVILIEC